MGGDAVRAVTDVGASVAAVPWYHTIELPGGVVTPGRWDTRRALPRIPFPASLAGKRCLDVGTYDGFWAFEMERRGAAETVAIDLADAAGWDWPDPVPTQLVERWKRSKAENRAFSLAHEALGSKVERVETSVYDVTAEALGAFDFVFVGSLLLHLQDPVRALRALRSLLRGELLSADQVSLGLSLLRPRTPAASLAGVSEPHWWTPNLAAHRRLLRSAGFEIVAAGGPYLLRPGPGAPSGRGLRGRFMQSLGVPHAWVRARPSRGPVCSRSRR